MPNCHRASFFIDSHVTAAAMTNRARGARVNTFLGGPHKEPGLLVRHATKKQHSSAARQCWLKVVALQAFLRELRRCERR